jgi:surfactin synthase thioesterase subunit
MVVMHTNFDKKWFMAINKVDNPSRNIICFPWGGGGASAFLPWRKLACPANVWALKLPGREGRIDEPVITHANELVEQIIKALPSTLSIPYVFYGHSMGAGLAMQTIIELQKKSISLPQLLIASGRMPPNYPSLNPVKNLSDKALLNYLQALGSLNQGIPLIDDFLKQYIPKIRADYHLNSTIPCYQDKPLPVRISIINGENDSLISLKNLSDWQKHTTYPIHSEVVPGGHFFMNENFTHFMEFVLGQIDQLTQSKTTQPINSSSEVFL